MPSLFALLHALGSRLDIVGRPIHRHSGKAAGLAKPRLNLRDLFDANLSLSRRKDGPKLGEVWDVKPSMLAEFQGIAPKSAANDVLVLPREPYRDQSVVGLLGVGKS